MKTVSRGRAAGGDPDSREATTEIADFDGHPSTSYVRTTPDDQAVTASVDAPGSAPSGPDASDGGQRDHPAPKDGMMKDSTRGMRRPRRAWPPAARTAAAIITAAALILLAACSSSSSSAGSGGSAKAAGSANSPSAVTYSQCMRSRGVPHFPDPLSNGQVPKGSAQQWGVSSSQLQAAQTACQDFYPNNGGSGGVLTKDSLGQCEETGDCPQALVQAAMTALRAYAKCMRSHGVPNWPDPTLDSEGRPGFNLVPITGTNWNSQRISNIMQECYPVMPNGAPVPLSAPGSPG